ncbi:MULTISPECIES: GDSL-type esterase/lipase family protein [unclassified Leifsonia]|uniref:SGNH/GDSL hydrolase family protein n=1 Tax=unclassified Leifsonia TaxID=2663824 RepID=UPI0008A740C1|nr:MULTISPECIES: GDSL-type esterase/lipase family protein [unclassified Leifsonia]SEI17493.1 acyl-CoA thioesterase-1 [Leifsonia sp. CL154]SFL91449.1 acyl-CoA thioesterase-1 [Leifsonia sp. CL147]
MPLLAPAALTVALLALAGCSATPAARPVAAQSTVIAAPAAGGRAGATGAVNAVAIGDSIAFGKGVTPAQAWPSLVAAAHGWRLTDLAVSGSGFVKAGWNGTTYRQQVDAALRLHPQVILLAATRNDRDEDPAAVTADADTMLRELREKFRGATIVGITGIWGSDHPPATMSRVDEIVGDAVRDVDGTWLDIGFPLVGHPELVQADGIHPNAAGQRVVAQAIDSKLRPLNLAL